MKSAATIEYERRRRKRYATDPDYRAAAIAKVLEWRAIKKQRGEKIRNYNSKRSKRRDSYRRAQKNGFAGTFCEWAATRCPLLRKRKRKWRLIKMNRPRTAKEQHHYQYATNPAYVMDQRIGVALRKWMRGSKATATVELVGYTAEEFIVHIERQFTKRPKMTWDRVRSGEIHIDHVIPKSHFDYTNPDEVRRCWALPNLRPMWAADNIEKRAKRTHLL